ncbi:MAG: 2,3,4,5-tetrahydropyridine-2,6-dicarboxylate N-succinyltransferase, partial [Bacteroidales bacterium]|nr:2,3,4,5-tetrahydropyridine-2,6-dicarboxylate N-succinyltransferase [Bacteroidales bacterium]
MELQKELIEAAWLDRKLLRDPATGTAIVEVLEALDKGQIRVAQEESEGWKVNEWVKKAVILYFPIRGMEVTEAGPLEFHDKIPLKRGYA